MFSTKRLQQYFCEMVSIDSPSFNERKLADYILRKLNVLGLEVKEDDAGEKIGGNAGNIIGYLPGRGKDGPRIFLAAHMDRVEPGVGITPVMKDGIYYSQGDTILAADDVSGIAAILESLTVLREKELDHCPLKVIFTVAEEVGLLGAKALDPAELDVDYGYAYDCTGEVGDMVVEAPTQNEIKIFLRGKASHAGVSPEEGINAIKVAAEAIAALDLGRIDEETTANIGIIKGGQATNIVPDEVILEGEVRSRSKKRLDEYSAHMEEVFTEKAHEFGAQVEFKCANAYPLYRLDSDAPVVRRGIAAVEAIGKEYRLLPTGGGSDANVFNGKGVPTVNLATGMEKVHSTEEYIPLAQMEDLVALTLKLVTL